METHGKPVSIRFEKQTAYVYLLVDCSGSMAGLKLEQAKKGILDFAKDAFQKEYLVGLISFDSSASHICEPTYDIGVLKSSVEQIQSIGATNMADAIIMAHQRLNHPNSTRVIVIATDGQPDNVQYTLEVANNAKADKIGIIAIGTDDADREFLKQLASQTQLGNKVTVKEFSQAISSSVKLLPAPKRIAKR